MKFKSKNIQAFTLIEFVVVITIFFILVSVSYIPYNYYIKKAKLRNSIREISQSLYEARNMAINGATETSNVSVWLYINIEDSKQEINFISYPHSYTWSQITNELWTEIMLIKKYKLLPDIDIVNIDSNNNALFFFESITWDWHYYTWDSSWNKTEISAAEIDINVSYKWASLWTPLSWKLQYFTNTNIVDY